MQAVVYPELVAFACETEDVELSPPLRDVAVALVRNVHRALDGVPFTEQPDIARLARVVGRSVRELADTYAQPDDE